MIVSAGRNLLNFVFFVSIVVTQFYIFDSGLPQPSHLLLLFFSMVVLSRRFLPAGVFCTAPSMLFLAFFCYVLILNSFWSIYYNEVEFNVSTVYFAYNIVLMYAVLVFLYDGEENAKRLLVNACLVGVLVLFFIWLSGAGRARFFPRYNGFFNDPNQMAFWVLCVASIYYMLTEHGVVRRCLFLVVCVVLIFATMSRSALVGLAAMSLGILLKLGFFNSRHVFLQAVNLIISLGVMLLLAFYLSDLEVFSQVSDRVEHTSIESQLRARGYDRVINYPEHLIIGAGQGLDERFGLREEVHSTWVGLFFYYGVFGFILFFGFFILAFKRLAISDILICLGPVFYGFSTFGARTPIFWIFLSVIFIKFLWRQEVIELPITGRYKDDAKKSK